MMRRMGLLALLLMTMLLLCACGESEPAETETTTGTTAPTSCLTIRFATISASAGDTVGDMINSLTLSQRRALTYVELLNTSSFYEQVAGFLDGTYSANDVMSMATLSADSDGETGVIIVTVSAQDQQRVQAVGDAIKQIAPSYVADLLGDGVVLRYIEESWDTVSVQENGYSREIMMYINTHVGDTHVGADTCEVILMSRLFLQAVYDECDGRLSYEEIRSMLSVSREEETAMLRVTVTGDNAVDVDDVTQAVGRIFPKKLQEIVADAVVDCYFGELTAS